LRCTTDDVSLGSPIKGECPPEISTVTTTLPRLTTFSWYTLVLKGYILCFLKTAEERNLFRF